MAVSRNVLSMLVALRLMRNINLSFWNSVWLGVGGVINDGMVFLLGLLAWGWLIKPMVLGSGLLPTPIYRL
jgi:hypothetical protein